MIATIRTGAWMRVPGDPYPELFLIVDDDGCTGYWLNLDKESGDALLDSAGAKNPTELAGWPLLTEDDGKPTYFTGVRQCLRPPGSSSGAS